MTSTARPSHGGLIRPRNQPHHGSLLSQPIVLLLIGFLFGGVVMFIVMVPLDGISSRFDLASVNSVASSSPQGKEKWMVPAHVGWHPILVYYGPSANEGLHIDDLDKNPNQWFSQVHQDEIVYDLLSSPSSTSNSRKGGDNSEIRGVKDLSVGVDGNHYFIDLAANDAKEFSNTLALEQRGWNGLCIEPNSAYWYGLSHRKCTVVGAMVGGSQVSKVDVKFRGVYGGIVGNMDNKLANRKKEPDAPVEQRFTAPLRAVLNQFHVPKVIDYLSLDVEGAEYMIMQHFPFEKMTIRILTVERPSDQLKGLLRNNNYIFLRKLSWWGETLWAHASTGLTPDHPKISKWDEIIDKENKH
ncbi:hypothetical protein ACA910_022074 [Epithemia clementina (nom. ined.)]